MHGSHAAQRQIVVHHGEHALFHFAAVPGVQDDLLTAGDVEGNHGLGVESEFLVVLALGLGSGIHNKVRGENLEFFLSGLDEHVADEVSLPCNFHHKADSHAGILVGTAESIHDIQLFAAQLLLCSGQDRSPGFLRHGMVVILVAVGGPPDGVLGVFIHNDILVFGRTAGINAGHDIYGTEFGQNTLVIAFQRRVHFVIEKSIIGRIIDDFFGIHNAVLGQINICHVIQPLSMGRSTAHGREYSTAEKSSQWKHCRNLRDL